MSAFSTYELLYQPSLVGNFGVVPFAITPGGAADLTSVRQVTDGSVTAYVDTAGSRGGDVVGLKLAPYSP